MKNKLKIERVWVVSVLSYKQQKPTVFMNSPQNLLEDRRTRLVW